MKKVAVFLFLVAFVSLMVVQPTAADSKTDAALALGAFAVFNQLVGGHTIFHNGFLSRETVVVHQPPTVIYVPSPPAAVIYAPPPSPIVVHPNGGYLVQHRYWGSTPTPYHSKHYKKYYKRYKKHHGDDD